MRDVPRAILSWSSGKDSAYALHVLGDLFLAETRAYREQRLGAVGVRGVFPLWLRDRAQLAREMIASGLRATLTCVDLAKLPASFAGRTFDATLLDDSLSRWAG